MSFFRGFIVISLVSFILFACGGGGDDGDDNNGIAPVRPSATISGHDVDALIVGASISVYSWQNGTVGDLLGTATTDEEGYYSLEIQAADQPVLLVSEGGYYVEEASNVTVNIKTSQKLYAVTHFQSGKPLNVMVTPYTTLAYGLTQHYLEEGENAENAITKGLSAMTGLLDVNVLEDKPLNITDPSNASAILSDGLLYGFYTAALSSWTKEISEENGVNPHTHYTSIQLTQLMYEDVVADGSLDGLGADGQPISMGTTLLSAEVYRQKIGLHLINAASADYNESGLTVEDILGSAEVFSQRVNGIFPSDPLPLDNTPPKVYQIEAAGQIFAGTVDYEFEVEDIVGIETIEVSISGKSLGSYEPNESGVVSVVINTNMLEDGEHTISIVSTDTLGNFGTSEQTILINNTGVIASLTSKTLTNIATYKASGEYVENSTEIASILVNDTEAAIDTVNGAWTADIELIPGANEIIVVAIDDLGNEQETSAIVDYDSRAPKVTSGTHSIANFLTGDQIIQKYLSDSNKLDDPISIDAYNTALNGMQINEETLNAASIPFFKFSVQDPDDNGVSSDLSEISVYMNYSIGSEEKVTSKKLESAEGVFIIPFAEETLHKDWDQASENDVHFINIEIADKAGNVTDQEYSFKTHFETPILIINSLNQGSEANVYSWNGTKGGLIDSCDIDSNGSCSINIFCPNQPILISLTEGNYLELGTGAKVSMEENTLSALVNFGGENLSVTVTPLTTISSSYAGYLFGKGVLTPAEATTQANSDISNLYQISDITKVIPVDISDVSSASNTITDELVYSFTLAGMSKWTEDAATNNGAASQSFYNSLLLSKRMSQDIGDNGFLDGGYAFGSVALTTNTYRNSFANSLLDVLGSSQNSTTIDIEAATPLLVSTAENTNDIYGATPVTPFDEEAPYMSLTNYSGEYLFDDFEFIFNVSDQIGVKSVDIYFDDSKVKSFSSDIGLYAVTLDTDGLTGGTHSIKIVSTDKLDNTGDTSFDVKIDDASPVVELTNFTTGGYVSEEETFNFTVTDSSEVKTVEIYFDNTKLQTYNGTKDSYPLVLDTELYDNGTYELKIIAYDKFDNATISTYNVVVDNAEPVVTILSGSLTNETSFTFEAQVTKESGAEISEIKVNGKKVLADGSGNISTQISISYGYNDVEIVVTDSKGTSYTFTTEITCDTYAPYFKPGAGMHSSAKFHSGNSVFTGQLAENNTQYPLYFTTENVSLNGTPINTTSLNSAGIPYFGALVIDTDASAINPDLPKIVSEGKDIKVEIQYLQNDEVFSDWRETPELTGGSFENTIAVIVPITEEVLGDNWWKVSEDVIHKIKVRATDVPGNSATQIFTFKAYVDVPVTFAVSVSDQDASEFDSFAVRAALNNKQILSTKYNFANTTDKTIYLKVSGYNSENTVVHKSKVEKRENKAQLKTIYEWRAKGLDAHGAESKVDYLTEYVPITRYKNVAGTIHSPKANCPSLGPEGIGFIWEYLPDPVTGSIEFVYTDNPTKTATAWTNIYDEAPQNSTRSFNDFDWVFEHNGNEWCATSRWYNPEGTPEHLQKRERYEYIISDGYPRNIVNEVSETTKFTNSSVVIKSGDYEITPNSDGYYLIPAGTVININKYITLPSIDVYPTGDITYTETQRDVERKYTLSKNLSFTYTIYPGMPVKTYSLDDDKIYTIN